MEFCDNPFRRNYFYIYFDTPEGNNTNGHPDLML